MSLRRRTALAFFLLLSPGLPAAAVVDEGPVLGIEPGLPDARGLLDTVVSSLPGVPVKIDARIIAKTLSGKTDRKLNAEMLLDWHGAAPFARYTIEDAFGRRLEQFEIRWRSGGRKDLRYWRGDPPEETDAKPDIFARIEGTDISWIDLTLAYLWWPGGRTVGAEPVKGRLCYMIDLPAPAEEPGGYAGVRLWVDAQIHILLQAAAYDGGGQLVKLLEVKSFKKVRDVWMIQNLDIQSFPARHKTSLRVQGAEIVEGRENGADSTTTLDKED